MNKFIHKDHYIKVFYCKFFYFTAQNNLEMKTHLAYLVVCNILEQFIAK